MMSKAIRIPIVLSISLFIGILLNSCTKLDAASGDIISNRVEVEDFDKIVLHIGGQVNFTQENITQITVQTNEAVFDALKIYVKDNTLHIDSKSGVFIENDENLIFEISDNDTYSITICGSGNVNADFNPDYLFAENKLLIEGSGDINAQGIQSEKQSAVISGSGNIKVTNMQTENLRTRINGSGNTEFFGIASHADLSISGSGNINAYKLSSQQSEASISGSGNISVLAENSLNADISGSGNISYKGFPTLVSSISGSGEIINAN